MTQATLAVIAKAPATGRSKTRLSPPLSLAHAAELAEAALADTLAAAAATTAARKVLVLDGGPGSWLRASFEVIGQRRGGLDERLAGAFADLGGPTLVIGMDTPQISTAMLEHGLGLLGCAPAVLGPAADGGYWAIGLRQPDSRALLGVPMSTAHTLAAQRMRLRALGLAVRELEILRDVDLFSDALAVAAEAPDTRFARALAALPPVSAAA
jgi:rSAM/selenodomain-associated transferase 1